VKSDRFCIPADADLVTGTIQIRATAAAYSAPSPPPAPRRHA
jgi:hypothetical protein